MNGSTSSAATSAGGLSWAERLCDRVEWLTVRLAALALVAMVTLTTCDALGRYFLSRPIPGTMELTEEFLMPMLVYFSISFVYRMGGHVRVTIVSDHFPKRAERAVLIVFDALAAVLFALLTWGMLHRTLESYSLHEYSSSPLGYLLAPSFAIVVVGSMLMVLRTATAAITGRHPSANCSTDVDSY